MNLENIYNSLKQIENSEDLFPVIDDRKNNLTLTSKKKEASSIESIGNFFLKIFEEYDFFSDQIEFFQRSFSCIQKNLELDKNLRIFSRYFKSSYIYSEEYNCYVDLLKEKEVCYEIEEKMNDIWEKKQLIEKQLISSESLFPENKIFILKKIEKDLNLTEKEILEKISELSRRKLKVLKKIIEQIQDEWDVKKFRILKQKILGGVRFNEDSRLICYDIFERPKNINWTVKNALTIRKTKIRINYPSFYGVHRRPHLTLKKLQESPEKLNPVSFYTAISQELIKYISTPLHIGSHINKCIEEYNSNFEAWIENPSIIENFIESFLSNTQNFLNECEIRLEDLDNIYVELKEMWEDRIKENKSIILKNREKLEHRNLLTNMEQFSFWLCGLQDVPGVLNQDELWIIETTLLNLIVEIAEKVKSEKWSPDKAVLELYQRTLGNLQKYDIFLVDNNREVIEQGLFQLFAKNDQIMCMMNRLFSLNFEFFNIQNYDLKLSKELLSEALCQEVMFYTNTLFSSIESINLEINLFNEELSNSKDSYLLRAKEILFRSNFVINEMRFQATVLGELFKRFLFMLNEKLQCNIFYHEINRITFQKIQEAKLHECLELFRPLELPLKFLDTEIESLKKIFSEAFSQIGEEKKGASAELFHSLVSSKLMHEPSFDIMKREAVRAILKVSSYVALIEKFLSS